MAFDDDALVERVRERAFDPGRRRSNQQSEFGMTVASLDLASLVAQIGDLRHDLDRVRTGGAEAVDPDLAARLDGIVQAMETPAVTALPAPATTDAVAEAERALGVELPPLLRRLLTEVANGGFGPGEGVFGVGGGWTDHGRDLVAMYELLVEGPYEEWHWPVGLLPLCHLGDGAYACVDAGDPAAPVLEWDEELVDEDDEDDVPTGPALTPVQPSLGAWIEAWLESPSPPVIGVDLHAVDPRSRPPAG